MALFSWFKSTTKEKSIEQKNIQMKEKMDSFNACSMWPVAKIQHNNNAAQHNTRKTPKTIENNVVSDTLNMQAIDKAVITPSENAHHSLLPEQKDNTQNN